MLALIDAEWRSVVGYEGLYEISRYGELRSVERIVMFNSIRSEEPITRLLQGKVISLVTNELGYVQGALYKYGKAKLCLVHRLVAEAFLQNQHNKLTVNHINEVKDDNRAENLEWCTQSENALHSSYKNRGELSGTGKLSNEQVLEIKSHLITGELNQTEIGALYDVSNHVIHKIKVGKNWGWLTGLNQEDK